MWIITLIFANSSVKIDLHDLLNCFLFFQSISSQSLLFQWTSTFLSKIYIMFPFFKWSKIEEFIRSYFFEFKITKLFFSTTRSPFILLANAWETSERMNMNSLLHIVSSGEAVKRSGMRSRASMRSTLIVSVWRRNVQFIQTRAYNTHIQFAIFPLFMPVYVFLVNHTVYALFTVCFSWLINVLCFWIEIEQNVCFCGAL